MITITEELLEAGKSINNGWSNDQVKLLGVTFPLVKGWKEELIGKQVSVASYAQFIQLKDKHLSKKKLTRIADLFLQQPQKAEALSEVVTKSMSKEDMKKIEMKAEYLTKNFNGSHTSTCTAESCNYPTCNCK